MRFSYENGDLTLCDSVMFLFRHLLHVSPVCCYTDVTKLPGKAGKQAGKNYLSQVFRLSQGTRFRHSSSFLPSTAFFYMEESDGCLNELAFGPHVFFVNCGVMG